MSGDVVPALPLGPVVSYYVVPALLPWRQQVAGVVAEIGGSAATPGHRCCRATLLGRAVGPGLPQEPRSPQDLAKNAADASERISR
jgi:hypothetical protein